MTTQKEKTPKKAAPKAAKSPMGDKETKAVAKTAVTEVIAPLTPAEVEDRKKLEVVVRNGLQNFKDVGKALIEINDRRLFRDEYGTFGDYCREEFNIDRSTGFRLINATNLAEKIEQEEPTLPAPSNERSVRDISKLPPEQQVGAYKEAVEKAGGAAPSVKEVSEVVTKKITKNKASGVTKTGATPAVGFSDEQLKKDKVLSEVIDRLGKLLGPQFAKAIKNGTLEMKRNDVMTLSAMKDAELKEIHPLIVENRWSVKKASGFLADMPDAKSTVEDLINYCIAGGGKYTATINKYDITITKKGK